MNNNIETIRNVRLYLLNIVKDLSVEEMNEIPAGFSNNIIWNLAHMTAAQQGICYLRPGLKPPLEEKYIKPYLPSTKPDSVIDETEIEVIKGLFLTSLDALQADYDKQLFATYTPWTTRYGVQISGIEDALAFLPFHEGFHSGYITALKRCVQH
jgi:uncharacterized damage-inducible protein DinB